MLAEIFTYEIFFMRLLKVFQTLRLVFSIFLHFTKRKGSRKYEKYCLFHRKGPFRSRDIQIFVIFSLSFLHFPDSMGYMKLE